MTQITSLMVKPGDKISASVTYSLGTFTATLIDATTNKSYTTTGTVSGATESTAEWIAAAPSSYFGVLPLANFETEQFGYDTTKITTTYYATVSGVNQNIGYFGSTAQLITMVSGCGLHSYVKAQPSALSSDETSFTATRHHS